MLTEELETVEQIEEEREMSSLNHSVICTKLLLKQLIFVKFLK